MSKPQWIIDDDGDLIGDGWYWITGERLSDLATYHDPVLYEWPLHLSEKGWVDVDQFEPVFREALENFGHEIDKPMMKASFKAARKQIQRSKEYSARLRAKFPEKYKPGGFPVFSMDELWSVELSEDDK